MIGKKATFMQLHQQHTFDIGRLAMRSGVNVATIDKMLRDEPVQKQLAMQVLDSVSRITGIRYGLHNVDIKMENEEENV